ncbi:hypothetical protein HDU76_000711 [Blyttiomyces sp. JEL0837]|nr:hypothetical protein HDU76_000711 [Blyttiomyces sp. JEL0837]
MEDERTVRKWKRLFKFARSSHHQFSHFSTRLVKSLSFTESTSSAEVEQALNRQFGKPPGTKYTIVNKFPDSDYKNAGLEKHMSYFVTADNVDLNGETLQKCVRPGCGSAVFVGIDEEVDMASLQPIFSDKFIDAQEESLDDEVDVSTIGTNGSVHRTGLQSHSPASGSLESNGRNLASFDENAALASFLAGNGFSALGGDSLGMPEVDTDLMFRRFGSTGPSSSVGATTTIAHGSIGMYHNTFSPAVPNSFALSPDNIDENLLTAPEPVLTRELVRLGLVDPATNAANVRKIVEVVAVLRLGESNFHDFGTLGPPQFAVSGMTDLPASSFHRILVPPVADRTAYNRTITARAPSMAKELMRSYYRLDNGDTSDLRESKSFSDSNDHKLAESAKLYGALSAFGLNHSTRCDTVLAGTSKLVSWYCLMKLMRQTPSQHEIPSYIMTIHEFLKIYPGMSYLFRQSFSPQNNDITKYLIARFKDDFGKVFEFYNNCQTMEVFERLTLKYELMERNFFLLEACAEGFCYMFEASDFPIPAFNPDAVKELMDYMFPEFPSAESIAQVLHYEEPIPEVVREGLEMFLLSASSRVRGEFVTFTTGRRQLPSSIHVRVSRMAGLPTASTCSSTLTICYSPGMEAEEIAAKVLSSIELSRDVDMNRW